MSFCRGKQLIIGSLAVRALSAISLSLADLCRSDFPDTTGNTPARSMRPPSSASDGASTERVERLQ